MELSISTDLLSIVFDAVSGSLVEMHNSRIGDSVIRSSLPTALPFVVHADPPGTEIPLSPVGTGSAGDDFLELMWTGGGLECVLSVAVEERSARSLWNLRIRNIGAEERSLAVEFPRFNGVMPDPEGGGARGHVTDQYGRRLSPAVFENPPIQWHCLCDVERRSALGIIVKDPSFGPKTLVTGERLISFRHTGPFRLRRGGVIRLPEIIVLAEKGDWRGTAEEYRRWRARFTPGLRPPRWFYSGIIWGLRQLEADERAVRAILPSAPARGPVLLVSETRMEERRSIDTHGVFAEGTDFSLLPIRVSHPFHRPFLRGNKTAVRASLCGSPFIYGERGEPADAEASRWACAQTAVWNALVWGAVGPDPSVDDPGITARLFVGKAFSLVIAARLDPATGRLAEYHAPYRLTIPWTRKGRPRAAVCDLERLSWRDLEPFLSGGSFVVDESANWAACVVLSKDLDLVGFDPLPEVVPGGMVRVSPSVIAGPGRTVRVRISIPGCIDRPIRIPVGAESSLLIPHGVRPGEYPVIVKGRNSPCFVRFLRVLG